jgi:hypothetical protein
MHPDVLQLSAQLQKEACSLLKNKALWQAFTKKGKIHSAGSTYLDLLIFPDLDIYFETIETSNILKIFAQAVKNLIVMNEVTSIEFEKELHIRYPKRVPEGLFLQYRINNGNRLWKVDIWAVKDQNILNEKLKESAGFKARMTPDQRKLILEAKYKLMLPFGRTPMGSSYLVYKAVLEKGLITVDEIIAYVRDQGGNVDKLK